MIQTLVNWLFRPQQGGSRLPVDHERPDLETRLARVESQMTTITLSWNETLDKLQRWTNRLSAREGKRINQTLDAIDAREDAPGPTNGEPLPQDSTALKIALRKRLQAQNSGGAR